VSSSYSEHGSVASLRVTATDDFGAEESDEFKLRLKG